MGSDLFDHSFFVVGKIAIAAHDRCHHLALARQGLFQESPWSERTRLDTYRRMGFFFPAQTTEKGIEVMHHTQDVCHALSLVLYIHRR